MFHLWLVYRFTASGRRLLNTAAILSLIGMALGVASLTVAMGVVAGFQSTLRSAIVDVFGDVVVIRRGEHQQNVEEILAKVKSAAPEVRTFTPFVRVEGLLVGGGKLTGIELQGFDPKSVDEVLRIRPRVIEGAFALGEKDGVSQALVGKAIAKRFGLKVGQEFKIVMPVSSTQDSTGFSPKVKSFLLSGILDLGKADYDERFVVSDLKSVQKFADIGDGFSGIRIKISDSSLAPSVSSRIAQELGSGYFVSDWTEVNRNLFEAVAIERVVIFFVIMIMVIAASFNIASNLFVSVLKKYADISILRALGFTQRDVMRVFMTQGLFFGAVGVVAGLILGLIFSLLFVIVQKFFVLLPVETYRVDHIGVVLRPTDLLLIVSVAMVVCLISTIIPARRGAKLDPVEGLRYD
jgi:lipoprotein-releasing system permease protein